MACGPMRRSRRLRSREQRFGARREIVTTPGPATDSENNLLAAHSPTTSLATSNSLIVVSAVLFLEPLPSKGAAHERVVFRLHIVTQDPHLREAHAEPWCCRTRRLRRCFYGAVSPHLKVFVYI